MILILGGGFIGMRLYTSLKNQNSVVKVISKRFSTSNEDFFVADIREPETYINLLNEAEVIVHAAHSTVPSTSVDNAFYDAQTNILPFISLIEKCSVPKKFVYISSGGAVYGSPDIDLPITEAHPTNPLSPYGVSKLACEKYLNMYKEKFSDGIVILRPSNVYGLDSIPVKPQGVIEYIIASLIQNRDFMVWGNGEGKKGYIYIDDFISAVKCAITKEGNINTVFNVCSGDYYSVSELIGIVNSISSRKISTVFLAAKHFDVNDIRLNSILFRETYGWEPKANIQDYFIKRLQDHKSQF